MTQKQKSCTTKRPLNLNEGLGREPYIVITVVIPEMALLVMEFQDQGYMIRKVFALRGFFHSFCATQFRHQK
jgi:hypothetical protein